LIWQDISKARPVDGAFLGAGGISQADQTKTDVVDRLNSSTQALHQILAAPTKGFLMKFSRVPSA
jgi:hypothetical protein